MVVVLLHSVHCKESENNVKVVSGDASDRDGSRGGGGMLKGQKGNGADMFTHN